MTNRLNLILLTLLIIMSMLALTQNKDPGRTTTGGWPLSLRPTPDRIVVAQQYAVLGLDPHAITDLGSARISTNIYEGLVRFKPGTALVEPCLATAWEVSDNGLVWTFKLRPNVQFHDGSPFNARVVQLNFAQHLNRAPGQAAGYADFVYAPLDRVEIVDQFTIKLHLKYPYAPLLNNLAMPMAAPLVSPKTTGQNKNGKDKDSLGTYPAGTGPFMLAGEYAGSILLKANRKHWQNPPPVKEILFTTVPEAEKRAELLQKEQVDIALDLTFNQTAQLRSQGYPVFRITGLDICYLGFYARQKPFNRPALRKAVALALDRPRILNELWPQEVRPALGALPPTTPGYQGDQDGYNPDKAGRLLKETGYGDGLTFTLITYTDPRPYTPGGGEMLARALARSLAGANIQVKIKTYPWEEFKQALVRREGDAFLYGWISDNGDPDNFLYTLLAKSQIQSGQNATGYYNHQLDTLLVSARNTTDPEIRRELYSQAQTIINRDTPWVVLGHSLHHAATTPNIKGFVLSPTGWHWFYDITKNPK